MKALSIRQPWCWMILNFGKDIENRNWKPSNPSLRFRGEFLIHASSGMTRAEYRDCMDVGFNICAMPKSWVSRQGNVPAFPSIDNLERGGIVGVAEIVDVVCDSKSPWFFGPIGLVLRNAQPLPFRPLKGQLGFFEVNDE